MRHHNEVTMNEQLNTPNFAPKLYSITLIVVALILGGLWVMSRFVAADVARDLNGWKEKLTLIAESRQSEVASAIKQQSAQLRGLANNLSLQLYLTELEMIADTPKNKKEPMPEPAQQVYLRNLLIYAAEQGGYTAQTNSEEIQNINANAEEGSSSGLAIVNKDGEIIVSTNLSQAARKRILQEIKNPAAQSSGLIDIYRDGNVLGMGHLAPIYAIQSEQTPENIIGWVVGIKSPHAIYGLLKHPGVTEKTLETLLLRDAGDDIDYISPLLDGTDGLSIVIAKTHKQSVEVDSFKEPGRFTSELKDHMKKPVLAISRRINGTPWLLLVKIEREEALKVSTDRRNSTVALFFMILFSIILLIVAIWWYSSSKRSLMLSHHFRRMAETSQAQEKLLRTVTDTIPEPIFIIDNHSMVRFGNLAMAKDANMSVEHLPGKHINDIRGTAGGTQISDHAQTAIQNKDILMLTGQHKKQGAVRIVQSCFVPVDRIPQKDDASLSGALVVEQDITEAVSARERRIKMNQALVQTLLTLVDRRDPFSANHSLMTSQLSGHIAKELDADETTMETTTIAASLMNVGKIVVPRVLLTKTEQLSDEERKTIRHSMQDAAELIKPIAFDGPVYETLRQWQEKWDGTGPLGLKGEGILLPARILAVANSYVGMISPRSWRDAISHEEANKFLMSSCDMLFDRKVVVALIHFMENQQGKNWLAGIKKNHKETKA